MSDLLLKKLREMFPPVGPKKFERITTYPPNSGKWIEKIHLNLIEKRFLDLKEPIVKSREIEEIAENIFDVEYDFYEHQEEGNVILFRPNFCDEYNQNYSGHYIALENPLKIPKITISTGNRGSIQLMGPQREKYLLFVEKTYKLFSEKLIKVKK